MSIALIGSGNPIFKDAGVGIYTVKYIEENFHLSADVKIVDGGILGLKLLELLEEFDVIVLINTSSKQNLEAGTIVIQNCEEFIEDSCIKKTANEVEIAEMIGTASLMGILSDITIVSIVPKELLAVEVGLSKEVTKHFGVLVDTTLKLLHSKGISAEKKGKLTTLEEIIGSF